MASKNTSSSPAKSAPPTLLAFRFASLTPATYHVTRVAWSPDAYQIVAGLREALRSPAYDKPKELPIKDLRLRTQVYDPGVVRVNARLGIGHPLAEGEALNILFTSSAPADASEYANNAVAHWVDEAVKKIRGLKPMDARIAQGLRDMAVKQQAIGTKADKVKVFQWATNEATNAALPPTDTGFADLADYVAAQLVGKVIFPAAGPLRREIGSTLDKGYARLLTDPEMVPMGAEAPCYLSLGLTITVATYPGRPLPVILLNMGKRVWTTGPKGSFFGNDLGGFVLPTGEDRAFKFSVDTHRLSLDDDYRAITVGYPDLPAEDSLTASDLVRTGGHYPGSRVLVAAAPGRSLEKVAGRGVTDLDRQLAFERLTELLAPLGFTPWGNDLQRVETGAKTLNGLVGKWDVAHHAGTDEEKAKDQVLQEWTRELHAGLNQFYDGTHRILLAYQTGLHDDALLRAAGSKQPVQLVAMQPLKQALLALATHGPSYLAEHSSPQKVLGERQQLTEAFLHDVLLSRSRHYADREIVLLADTSTLGGIWRWLADAQVNPADVRLHGLTEFQKALPNVTFVRLRHNHSPKALLPTEHVKVSFAQPDGTLSEPRLSARWADAKLYRLTDPTVGLPTYLSYGSRMFQPVRSASSYRPTYSVKKENTTLTAPFTKTWATPNPLEITVLQDPGQPARFQPDELAFLVETLRSSYDHFGGWTTLPGPLHFASVLKEYVPDYALAEEEAAAKEEAQEEKD